MKGRDYPNGNHDEDCNSDFVDGHSVITAQMQQIVDKCCCVSVLTVQEVLSMTKPRRFVAGADSHGDMICPESRKAIIAFIKDYKPQVRVHLGDILDLRNLRNGASANERAESNADDFEQGYAFAEEFFRGGEENHLLLGNHDARLWDAAGDKGSGVTRDYAAEKIEEFKGKMKRLKVAFKPYDARLGVLRIGHLKMIHGYASGRSAATTHARIYRNCLFGHTHTIEVAATESDEGPQEARGIGALCQLDMPYNSRHTNKLRHANGWAYGLLFDDGSYQLFQARKINGKFYACHDASVY